MGFSAKSAEADVVDAPEDAFQPQLPEHARRAHSALLERGELSGAMTPERQVFISLRFLK